MVSLNSNSEDLVCTEGMPWIPTSPGKSFRPLRFEVDGWSELMRLESGSLVARHRHTGPVHAFNLTGSRRILETAQIIGPGDYVYEPADLIDSWQAIGEGPCVVLLKIQGAAEYLDSADQVIESADSASQARAYLAWCEQNGVEANRQILGDLSDQGSRPPDRE